MGPNNNIIKTDKIIKRSADLMDYLKEYGHWLENLNTEEKKELEKIKNNDAEIKDRFYKALEFGTAGLRGVIGMGLNRMNVYVVGQATQGLANQLIKTNPGRNDLKVTIAYDSRHKSDEFAKTAAEEGWQGMLLLEKKANSLYGMYTGQAQTMFNLPLTMVVALSMSIVPAISTAVAARRRSEAIGMTESVLRITMLFAMPCAIGMSVLSGPILGLLYGGDTSASLLLQKLSIAVIFVALVSVSNAVLQAYGRVYYPVVNMLIGGAVKVAMNYIFIPVWGIDGAPIATNACYAVIALLNIICIVRILKAKFSITDMVIKPLCASLIMGAAAAAVYNVLSGVTGGSRICVLAAIAAGGIIYVFAVLALRALRREDILNMPKGEKIEKILTKYKLL